MRKTRKLRAGTRELEVRYVRKSHPKLKGATGRYYEARGVAYVRDDLRGSILEDATLHEVVHWVLDVHGLWGFLAQLSGHPISSSKFSLLEENFVRLLTPMLLDMKKNGVFEK